MPDSNPWNPPPIWLGENHVWDEDLSLYEAADLLLYLHSHDPYQIKNYVLPRLKIPLEPPTPLPWAPEDERNEYEEMLKEWEEDGSDEGWEEDVDGGDADTVGDVASETDHTAPATAGADGKRIEARRQVRVRRGMLKGLTMELLTASILRRITKCHRVVTWAKTLDGEPHVAAGGGYPDITAVFPGGPTWGEFRLLLEVSANRRADKTHFKIQLAGAFKHATKESERFKGIHVYVLLINGCEVFDPEREFHGIYLKFLNDNELTPDSAIRIVPMYAPDFGVATGSLFFEMKEHERYFEPRSLVFALDTLHREFCKPVIPGARMWMADTFRAGLREKTVFFPKRRRKKKDKAETAGNEAESSEGSESSDRRGDTPD